MNNSKNNRKKFIRSAFFLKAIFYSMKKWNTGGAIRNNPEIIVWIYGVGFISLCTPCRILNESEKYNIHFYYYYSCIHRQNLNTPTSIISKLWSFSEMLIFKKNRNISETAYFKHFVSFLLRFPYLLPNTECCIGRNISLVPNIFLRKIFL